MEHEKAVKKRERTNEMDNIQKLAYNHSNFERNKKTILICDDNQDVLLSFGLVRRSNYDVIMA
jgi:hypothetical protein